MSKHAIFALTEQVREYGERATETAPALGRPTEDVAVPVLLLHGAYMTTRDFGPLLPGLDRHERADDLRDIRGITAPTLIIVGDADAVRAEHAVEMLRLLGGGGMGDMTGVGQARLAILPGTSHFMPPGSGLDRSGWLLSMISDFLDAARADYSAPTP